MFIYIYIQESREMNCDLNYTFPWLIWQSECVKDKPLACPLPCSDVGVIKQQKASQGARNFADGKSEARRSSAREYFMGMTSYSELSTP